MHFHPLSSHLGTQITQQFNLLLYLLGQTHPGKSAIQISEVKTVSLWKKKPQMLKHLILQAAEFQVEEAIRGKSKAKVKLSVLFRSHFMSKLITIWQATLF